MSNRPPASKKKPRKAQPLFDRRAPDTGNDTAGSLRKVKGALGRPMRLERRNGQLHIVFVERRRTPLADQAPMLAKVRADLGARLADLVDTPAARLMRHLGLVSAELDRKGWPGVQSLPGSVLDKALEQAEMLASEEPSDLLAIFIERLRLLKVAAEVREERQSGSLKDLNDAALVVSEATQEEFEASQRSWESSLFGTPLQTGGTGD